MEQYSINSMEQYSELTSSQKNRIRNSHCLDTTQTSITKLEFPSMY